MPVIAVKKYHPVIRSIRLTMSLPPRTIKKIEPDFLPVKSISGSGIGRVAAFKEAYFVFSSR
jgi:hypothetical protein